MSAVAKSPAELIADLTDQVRLLRQDVGNLTATATTKAEAARLMARIEKASGEAFAHAQEVIDASEHLGRQMHQDSASAAQVAAERAIKGLEHEISAAANHMRLESVRSSKEALHRFGGGLAVFGGIAALGGVLGIVALLLIQGRGDAREFGKHPEVFCTSAGGEIATNSDGRRFCGIWIAGDHPLDLVFGQMGLAHSRLRSLALAGRIEITDTPWVPKAAKTTATVPSARRPIAMCRPAFAGTTTEARKNASSRSAKSRPCLARLVCRFGASQVIINMCLCIYANLLRDQGAEWVVRPVLRLKNDPGGSFRNTARRPKCNFG